MMSEMIERVAKALAATDGKDPDAPAWITMPHGETFGVCWRDHYADKARAVIEAMREPTEAMIEAGCVIKGEPFKLTTMPSDLYRIWPTMIDAALK